jgi:hypothetical protein
MGAEEAEEEVFMVQHSFTTLLFEATFRVPTFRHWFLTGDQTYAYEYLTRLLQLMEWYRDDAPERRWLLKSPTHLHDLDALLAVCPDAKILWIHRDPVKSVASGCSLCWHNMVLNVDSIDAPEVARSWYDTCHFMVEKGMRIRDERLSAGQIMDVSYAELMSDTRSVMQGIYKWLDIELTPAAETAIHAWHGDNPQHKQGVHRYRLEDFGLAPQEVEERFRPYRERFDIPVE